MKKYPCKLALAAGLLLLFVLFTVALLYIDVNPIGPNGSSVGFAALNGAAHRLLGEHMRLYVITDWLSIAAILVMLGFAVLGLVQWIGRRSLLRVDRSLLVLGGFYLLVLGAYLFFEYNVVNRRPVLIGGVLEASYPSSTTMLLLCSMSTAMMQFHRRIQRRPVRIAVNALLGAFALAMVVGRTLSGVHWITDILGAVLLSAALVLLYSAAEDYLLKSE